MGKELAPLFVLERWTVEKPCVGLMVRPSMSPVLWTQIAMLSPKPKCLWQVSGAGNGPEQTAVETLPQPDEPLKHSDGGRTTGSAARVL